VLEGITRRIVLSLATELAIPVRLEAPLLADVPRLDEAFLSSASRGVLPVVVIDGQPVGSGRPGALAGRLIAAYRAYVARSIAPAI
jgi:branched-subunit amino acid aminotransferase/4-amino-4-deoxychorismate lyase